MTWRLIATCAFAALLFVKPVRAEPTVASAVDLYLPACASGPFDGARLVSLLRVELGAIGVSDVREKGTGGPAQGMDGDVLAAVAIAAPGCDAATEVTLEVLDRATSKVVERTMAVADVSFDERPRALAIAIAELLQASWAELELGTTVAPTIALPPEVHASLVRRLAPSSPPAPRLELPPARRPRLALPPTPARLFVDLTGAMRAFPARDTALLGGAATVALPASGVWRAQAGAEATHGESRAVNGTVGITALTGSAGIFAVAGRETTLELGPVVHAGYVWAHGTPNDASTRGRSFSHFVALALLSATLRVPASGFTALAGFDAGAALAEASFFADQTRIAGFGGVSLGVRLGAALGI